jgi:protein gp37
MATEWVQGIHKVCVTNSVPFFFKQWGGINKKKTGRLLDGQLWDEMPSL